MKRVSVFCGSSHGTDKVFEAQAYELGKLLAERNIELVYGGTNVGLMGAVANGALEHGGKVIGVVPECISSKGIAHTGLTELILVDTMHQRKAKMYDLSDGIITLPGGYGTLEELFEILTWAQLGLHKKPVAILNIDYFYDALLSHIHKMVNKGFMKDANKEMLIVSHDMEEMLEKMECYKAPVVDKWIKK